MSEIVWKPVEGFEDKYLVSNTGLVYGIKRKHMLKQQTAHNRYKRVMLSIAQNTMKFVWVHRLVAKAFCKGYFKGAEVNHIDCDGSNNDSSNLEWVSKEYNQFYKAMEGPHSCTRIRYKKPKKCLTMLRSCAIIYAADWSQEVSKYWRYLDSQGD